MSDKDKCKEGYSCGKACVSREKKCRSALGRGISFVVDNFKALIDRVRGAKKETETETEPNFKSDGKSKEFGASKAYQENLKKREDRMIKALGSRERYDQLNQAFRDIFQGTGPAKGKTAFEPIIYIKSETINLIAKQPPGERRLKNQFETGTSNALLDLEGREFVENDTLGVKGWSVDSETKEAEGVRTEGRNRPIYAGFGKPDLGYQSVYSQYGDLAFKVKNLKLENYTITGGDSLDSTNGDMGDDHIVGTSGKDFSIASLNTVYMSEDVFEDSTLPDLEEEFPGILDRPVDLAIQLLLNIVDLTYMETQIHQDIGLEDLELIDTRGGRAPEFLSREARKALGIV